MKKRRCRSRLNEMSDLGDQAVMELVAKANGHAADLVLASGGERDGKRERLCFRVGNTRKFES